jgi:hypothetical protein
MPCIHRRLITLCGLAYTPADAGALSPALERVGATSAPTIIERNLVQGLPRDRALVVPIAGGIAIAIRGTQPPTLASGRAAWSSFVDWANNVRLVGRDTYPGEVHDGFADAADALWYDADAGPGIGASVRSLLANSDARKLYIAGHSKGGAVANLVAWRAKHDAAFAGVDIQVVTFAAARAGDARFAERYAAAGIRCTRYEVATDIVPHLPPSTATPRWAASLLAAIGIGSSRLGFVPVGACTIDKPGFAGWLGDTIAATGSFARSLIRREPDWRVLASAHLIDADSRYDRLVCRHDGSPCPAHEAI